MKTWQGWVIRQSPSAKNKAMIYGYPIKGSIEVRVQANSRDDAASLIAVRLSELIPEWYFTPREANRPVAGKSYLQLQPW